MYHWFKWKWRLHFHCWSRISRPRTILLNLTSYQDKYMRSHKYKCWVFQAFKKAWKAACSSPGSVLVVPKNKNYLLKPITFQGPCKSSITVQVRFHDRSHFLQRFKQLFLIHVYCIKWLMIFLRKKKKKTRYMELSRHLLIDPPTVTIWPTGLSLKMSKI